MGVQHTLRIGWGYTKSGGSLDTAVVANAGPSEANVVPDAIPTGTKRKAFAWAFTPSAAASLYVHSDKNVTLHVNGTDDVQTITPPGSGTLTATFGGQTTAAFAWNAAASAVQALLRGLSSVGAGNLAVAGGSGSPFVVAFAGDLGLAPQSGITVSAGSVAHTTTGVVPDQTLDVLAEEPVLWWKSAKWACPITAAATKLSITNLSGGSANVQVRSV